MKAKDDNEQKVELAPMQPQDSFVLQSLRLTSTQADRSKEVFKIKAGAV